MIIYELPWILKWDYGFVEDDYAELPCSTTESSSKSEKHKSLIESSPSCSKKYLEGKVLKILELNGVDAEDMESEAASSHHHMDEDFEGDNEGGSFGIYHLIRPKK
ncbi:LRR receptor-like serine/threonine-protein kinase RLK [Pyrus ussuriensis x Pyrus communis]|uniref:LRR receptor-like serine/threonine-protein kinase RLK n=1 Tax=Pyrus ussuriensis x Pyrus communis TaxID=2448454 RepID=A0A5N5GHE6_9ROSA|nr:LRR receptor-like serine/threonine-protein kinase RLK [Pyrus ussuriensis x Pyrus communis]